jgi:hypothetical protein
MGFHFLSGATACQPVEFDRRCPSLYYANQVCRYASMLSKVHELLVGIGTGANANGGIRGFEDALAGG